MPKKSSKSKKNSSKRNDESIKRVLIYKEDMEEYAKIMKSLGDRRMSVILPDSTEMVANIPGKFRKRCWMSAGDIVLVSVEIFKIISLTLSINTHWTKRINFIKRRKYLPFL